MTNSFFQLDYDQLISIAKKFKDEGEDIVRLHSTTRQRVRDLHKEWIGEAAEKFFEEMETELLPAVHRLAQALFLSQDMTNEIMKIIQDADEETAGYFGSGDDFGASLFGSALDGLQTDAPGADDFGAGALGTPVGAGGSSADDFGAGKFGDALDNGPSSSHQGDAGQSFQDNSSQGSEKGSQQSEKEKQAETESSPAGGGGGSSSSSSEGLKGDLKKMGIGLSDQPSQAAYAGGDSSTGYTPDHIYSSDGSAAPVSTDTPSASNPASDSVPPSSDKGGAAAAGVAGVAGAAAAGKAAKVVKEQQDDSD